MIMMSEKCCGNHDSSVPNYDTYALLPLIKSNLPGDLASPCARFCLSAAASYGGDFT